MSDVKVAPEGLAIAAVLDARGLSCPMPLLRTKKEIGKITAGQILHVQGTDPGSRNDIPGWCERADMSISARRKKQAISAFSLKKDDHSII